MTLPDLDALSLDDLHALLADAEAALAQRRRQQDNSLQREMAQAARAAGLTAEEWRILVGD